MINLESFAERINEIIRLAIDRVNSDKEADKQRIGVVDPLTDNILKIPDKTTLEIFNQAFEKIGLPQYIKPIDALTAKEHYDLERKYVGLKMEQLDQFPEDKVEPFYQQLEALFAAKADHLNLEIARFRRFANSVLGEGAAETFKIYVWLGSIQFEPIYTNKTTEERRAINILYICMDFFNTRSLSYKYRTAPVIPQSYCDLTLPHNSQFIRRMTFGDHLTTALETHAFSHLYVINESTAEGYLKSLKKCLSNDQKVAAAIFNGNEITFETPEQFAEFKQLILDSKIILFSSIGDFHFKFPEPDKDINEIIAHTENNIQQYEKAIAANASAAFAIASHRANASHPLRDSLTVRKSAVIPEVKKFLYGDNNSFSGFFETDKERDNQFERFLKTRFAHAEVNRKPSNDKDEDKHKDSEPPKPK